MARRRCQGCHGRAAALTLAACRGPVGETRRSPRATGAHGHLRSATPACPRGTARGAPSVGPSRPPVPSATPDRGARTRCGRPPAPSGAAPGRRSRRAGSTRRGRRSEQPRLSDRAAAGSADQRAWRSRPAGWHRAGSARISDAPRVSPLQQVGSADAGADRHAFGLFVVGQVLGVALDVDVRAGCGRASAAATSSGRRAAPSWRARAACGRWWRRGRSPWPGRCPSA